VINQLTNQPVMQIELLIKENDYNSKETKAIPRGLDIKSKRKSPTASRIGLKKLI